jgi:polyhydroxyalkanoate synthase
LNPDKVKNLITTVTPVDFHTPNDLLSHLARHVDVDNTVDTLGNIPGELLNWSFMMLKPFRLMGQKYLDLVDILDDPDKLQNFMVMEQWIHDSPDQAGEAYREFIKYFYQNNSLIKGELSLAGRSVELKNITVPILNIYARDDHLVPPASSMALKGLTGSRDYTEMEFPGGHIGIYVSARAQKTLPPAIADWLTKRSQ